MLGSSESWGPQQHPHPWHFRAGGGAVHSIKSVPTQCSKLHLRSNTSSARATRSGESLPQQLGGGPDDLTIAFHNYGIDKAGIVFQPLNMLHGSFVIRTNRGVQNADLIGPL